MSAPLIERLSAVALAAQDAGHGERGRIFAAACVELNISRQTLYRHLQKITVRAPRKRRSDAGDTELSLVDAKLICAYILEHIRKNNKHTKPLDKAVRELRANGAIVAGSVDPETGEIRNLSTSAIQRAMRGYGVHPEQILAVEPVTSLASKHPNWCWQIDASLCVLYKLPDTAGYGIEEVKTTERYKNKLSHFAKIEHRLVQRYLITDHASCAVFIYYAFGGESAESLCMLLVLAIQQRERYPFFGIPVQIMLDRGSANRSATFKNLCKALGIKLIWAQGARAKGQVEKMHDVTELDLESGLKMATHIRSVDQLNQLGQRWMHWFNGTAIHSRHGKTRYAAWQRITSEQLITTNLNTEQLLLQAREAPKQRPVTPNLTVHFDGKHYDVSKVPGVMVGEKLLICRCAFRTGMAHAVLTDADGYDVFHQLPERETDAEWGWFSDSPIIGESHSRHADTTAQTVRKELEQLVMAAQTVGEAAANRKANVTPFAGAINPYKEMDEYQAPAYFPMRGTLRDIDKLAVAEPQLNAVQMMKWLKDRLQDAFDPAYNADLQKRFPTGATASELEEVLADLQAGRTAEGKARLRAV